MPAPSSRCPLRLLTACAPILLATAGAAHAGEVVRYGFNTDGDAEGWDVFASSRLVADGRMSGVPKSNDPQLGHDSVRCGQDARWDTLTVSVRELDGNDRPVPHDPTGIVLIFNVQQGAKPVNFGPPTTAAAPDADGFQTIAWDLSSFEPQDSGRIRLDVTGGPGTADGEKPGNRWEVDWIVLYDTPGPDSVPAEPSATPAR